MPLHDVQRPVDHSRRLGDELLTSPNGSQEDPLVVQRPSRWVVMIRKATPIETSREPPDNAGLVVPADLGAGVRVEKAVASVGLDLGNWQSVDGDPLGNDNIARCHRSGRTIADRAVDDPR